MGTEVYSVAAAASVLRYHALTGAKWGPVQRDSATTHKAWLEVLPLGQALSPGGTSVFIVGAFCPRQTVDRGWASFRKRHCPHDSQPVLGPRRWERQ